MPYLFLIMDVIRRLEGCAIKPYSVRTCQVAIFWVPAGCGWQGPQWYVPQFWALLHHAVQLVPVTGVLFVDDDCDRDRLATVVLVLVPANTNTPPDPSGS